MTLQKSLMALALSLWAACSWGQAETYPTRPITLVVPFPPGGPTDASARLIGKEMASSLGQPVVIENRAGAGGTVGSAAVARASADGYTLLWGGTSSLVVAPALYPGLSYDPIKSFAPIGMVVRGPMMIAGKGNLPAKNMTELIALAKRQPGRLNFAVGAMGSSLQLAGDAFKMQAGVQITNIPYRGTAPALQDVLAGQVELMFAAVGNVQAHVRTGKLKALAVTTRKRLPAFADVPSLSETLPGYESSAWFGLFGPARMPASTAQRLADAVRLAVQTPEVRQRIEGEGAQPGSSSPEEFARFVQSEIARWREVVVFSGAKPE